MAHQWTLELLKQRAAEGEGFSFFSELHPRRAVRAGGKILEFKDGYVWTPSPEAALELLSMDWVQPGQWAKDVERYIDRILSREAGTATKKRRAKR